MRIPLVILSLLGLSFALDDPVWIHAPAEIEADKPTDVLLDAEIHNGDTTYVSAFRVYLASSTEDKLNPFFYHSECYLIHQQSLCNPLITISDSYVLFSNTSVSVTIPSNIGPSGDHYVLYMQTLQTDGSYYGGGLNSDVFTLTGATGNWSISQTRGYTLWGKDGMACSGFACVKNCSDAAYANYTGTVGIGNPSGEAYHDCANACPNVSVDFENSTVGGQPTTDLTRPTSCSVQPLASTTARTTNSGDQATATRSRSAAAAVRTGAASPSLNTRQSFCLALASLAVSVVIG